MGTVVKKIGTVPNTTGREIVIDVAVTLGASGAGAFVGSKVGGAAGTAIGALVGAFVSTLARNQLRQLKVAWRKDGGIEAEMVFA